MKTVTSISGGKTSAYMAKHFSTDYNLFALVRTSNDKLKFKDEYVRKIVEQRINKEFVGTLEDDTIIYTILDLEQYLGSKINWVSGIPFDDIVKYKGGWLPNKLHRYCTHHLKIEPMFYWWAENIGKPVIMNIGYRANEGRRIKRMKTKLNKIKLLEFEATFEKHESGRHKGNNKWEKVSWQFPEFPLHDNGIYADHIHAYWKDKSVRFAAINNCVGCFHKNPLLLKKQFQVHPEKMKWFQNQEGGKNGYWRSDCSYKQIEQSNLQFELSFDDFNECDTGFCEL